MSLVFSLLFHLLSSLRILVLSRLLLSCLVLSSFVFSSLVYPLPSSLLSLSLSSFPVSLSLSLSLSYLRVVVWSCCCVVLCLVLWCVCGVVYSVVCVVWHAENPVCPFKTCPCVRSKRPRVYRHHAHMLKHMCAWCRYTRGRFERTHGHVLSGHTAGRGRVRQFCLPKFAHIGSTRDPEVHQK